MKFSGYLDEIGKLVKGKNYDAAWNLANKGVIDLANQGEEMWYMMYYQMVIILMREKKWVGALEKMGFVLFHLKQLHPAHEKVIRRIMKKLDIEEKFDQFVSMAKATPQMELGDRLKKLL